MPFKHRNLILSVVILSCLLVLGGCWESQRGSSRISGQSRPAYMVSVEELASKLGLSIRKAGKPQFELCDAKNTVRIFPHTSGSVYVNGVPVGKVSMQQVNGKTYVPELLVPQIRSKLIPSAPVQLPTPSYNSPLYYGSGTVVIDPGHGGKDPGAQSILGYWEKDINLKISGKLADYLRQAGVDVIMTRDSDTYPTLEDRAALANRVRADLFVSIHCNVNGNRVLRGFTIYRARAASANTKKAGRILEKHLSDAGIPSKGFRSQDYRVLVQTQGPAVLIECGFMSNYDEAAALMDPWYQNRLARAIADGILEYL